MRFNVCREGVGKSRSGGTLTFFRFCLAFFITALLLLSDLLFPGLACADHPSLGLGGRLVGPITVVPATPLRDGQWSIALQLEHQALDEISNEQLVALSEAHEDAHSVESLSRIGLNASYGFSKDLTLGASLPYISRSGIRESEHAHEARDTVVELGDSEGLGDLRLFGQYRFLEGETGNADSALLLGIKMPTGEDDERITGHGGGNHGHGNVFEAEHQPGSGSWDPFVGLAHSRAWNGVSLHTNVLYTIVTEGVQDTDLGDSLHYNLALGYRLSREGEHVHHHEVEDTAPSHDDPATWELMLGLNGEWREKLEIESKKENNSGGNLIYLSPGVRAVFASHGAASVSVGVPVLEQLNGTQSVPEVRLIGSLALSF